MAKPNHIIGTSLKKSEFKHNYDAIIVGSGIGGLTTGAILSKEGKKVAVLEKHYTVGGFTHVFKRRDWIFEVGVHYIGEMENPESLMRKISDYVTDGRLEWHLFTDNYDRVVVEGESFEFPAGKDNLQSELEKRFPEEKKAIAKYLKMIKNVRAASGPYYLERTLPRNSLLRKLLSPLMRRKFLSYSTKTTDEVLSSLTDNGLLKLYLTGLAGDYGLMPAESSFAIHALTAQHFINGANYPVGGGSAISKNIVDIIEENGSQVVTRAGVEEILVNNDRVVGVRLEDGQELFSDIVVSNAGLTTTYNKLFSKENKQKYGLVEQLEGLGLSETYMCLFIGLNGDQEELGLNSTNHWIYGGVNPYEDLKKFRKDYTSDFPILYLAFPSAKDPQWKDDFPGKSTAEIISSVPYEIFEKWQNTRFKRRGEDYENLKEYFSDRLLKEFIKHHPELEDKIAFFELSTPLSVEHFCNYEQGQIYGLNHKPERFSSKNFSFHGPIKGLYLTGQDALNVGIGSAFISGTLASLAILGPRKGRHLLSYFKDL
ncbi:MAG: NAD(P)/FAD-dependent oxidoreductase [archaeon]